MICQLTFFQSHIQPQKVSKPKSKVIFKKALFESIAMLQSEATKGLSGNKLLIDTVFVKLVFYVRISDIWFTVDKSISQQDVIVVF